jgi:uncharacterized membrane protein/DNA-directed RNA polymerase subunit RPC12/RpoP
MDIFCQKCQKRVGQVADEKIPVGQKASVKCPVCGEKIILGREDVATPDLTIEAEKPAASSQPPGFASHGRPGEDGGREKTGANEVVPNYDFTIGAILKEAWQKTSGVKGPIWGAALMIFLVIIGFSLGGWLLSTVLGGEGENLALSAALQITLTVAIYPLIAGVMMIGLRHSVGRPVSWKQAFGYFALLLPLVVSSLLATVLTFVGFLLLLLPGIYLSLAYMLVIPLIVDKGMGPWQAMEASRQAIHQCWFKAFGLYFVMVLIYLVSIIPLGLGMIWTLPMFVMVSAILYRELFGVSDKT